MFARKLSSLSLFACTGLPRDTGCIKRFSWLVLFSVRTDENKVEIAQFSVPIPNPNPILIPVCQKCDGKDRYDREDC